MRSTRALTALFALVLAVPLTAGTSNVAGGKQASALVWFQDLSGSLSGRDTFVTGTARLRKAGSTEPGFALSLKTIGSLVLDFSYTPLSVDTTFDATGGLSFGGTTYAAGTTGRLEYDMPIYETGLRWIALDNSWFRLCGALVLKVVDADVRVSTATQSSRLDTAVPIPQAGVSGQLNFLKWLKAYGSYKFLDLEIGPVSSSVHDWEAGVIVDANTTLKTFRGAAGYRRLSVDLQKDRGKSNEAAFDIRHEGPFAELTLSF
jgi:hypothetical protein